MHALTPPAACLLSLLSLLSLLPPACAQEQPRVKLVVKSERVPRWEIPVFTVLGIMLTVVLFSYLYHEKVQKQRLAAAAGQSAV